MSAKKYNPNTDIPDLSGKVIVVTGGMTACMQVLRNKGLDSHGLGNTGLGKSSVEALARHQPKQIYFTGRNATKCKAALDDIKSGVPNAAVAFIECDLASLQSCQQAARDFLSKSDRLDILICNAGVMNLPPELSKDGYEIHFATNHLGHALLIKLLLPIMVKTAGLPDADVRIINLSSLGHIFPPKNGIAFDTLKTAQAGEMGPVRYGQSKLANVLYASEIAKRYPQLTAVSCHPGVIITQLYHTQTFLMRMIIKVSTVLRGDSMKTPKEGVHNQLWLATVKKDNLANGEFYMPVGQPRGRSKMSKDDKLMGRLWDWTERELEPFKL